MVFGDKEIKLPSKMVSSILGILLTAAITFNVWVAKSVYARPTTHEVRQLIEDTSPYAKDRNMILQALQDIKSDIHELKELLRSRQ